MKPSKKLSILFFLCGGVLVLAAALSALLPILTGRAPVGIIGGAELPTLRYLLLGRRFFALLLGAALLLAGCGCLLFSKRK